MKTTDIEPFHTIENWFIGDSMNRIHNGDIDKMFEAAQKNSPDLVFIQKQAKSLIKFLSNHYVIIDKEL